jgi:ankyrin repeat protein
MGIFKFGYFVRPAHSIVEMDLWQASCDGDARAVDALLANERLGLDLNCVEDKYGMTPLYIASQEGHAEVVSMLLAKQGVNVNQAMNNGVTPIYIASQEGHAEVVSMLLAKHGVKVNQAMNDGATPLYTASQEGHAEVVSMLLAKQGVNVNQA